MELPSDTSDSDGHASNVCVLCSSPRSPRSFSSPVSPSSPRSVNSPGFRPDFTGTTTPNATSTPQQTSARWAQQNILCFDGGGVRGYFSLLVLQKLMEWVRICEDEAARVVGEKCLSSFSPCEVPANVSHLDSYQPYLPCHYFDYICGTSTGGLITIMLARLRMPVEDCLYEYENLAGHVFGSPRLVHSASVFGIVPLVKRTKYDTQRLIEAVRDVLRRRGETENENDDVYFQTQEGFCRAIVLAHREHFTNGPTSSGAQMSVPFLFRSYNHFSKEQPQQAGPDSNHGFGSPRNANQGTRYPVWKVALATTAAPLMFNPLNIYMDDGEVRRAPTFVRQSTGLSRRTSTIPDPRAGARPGSRLRISTLPDTPRNNKNSRDWASFTDAGLGPVNNPSEEAFGEIQSLLTRHHSIGTFVSIGTARSTRRSSTRTLLNVIRHSFQEAGDPSRADRRIQDESRNHGFSYFRLDDPDGLGDMKMDEWKPTGSGPSSGTHTIGTMTAAVDRWAAKPETAQKLQDCARALVQARRARSVDSGPWEQFATGKFYVCLEGHCRYGRDRKWTNRAEFERHLRNDPFHSLEPEEMARTLRHCGHSWEYRAPGP